MEDTLSDINKGKELTALGYTIKIMDSKHCSFACTYSEGPFCMFPGLKTGECIGTGKDEKEVKCSCCHVTKTKAFSKYPLRHSECVRVFGK